MNETWVTVVGNVSTSLRGRRTADGTAIASFRMATNERRYDRTTGGWVDGDHVYVSVTCWRRLAQNVLASLVKGDPVVVSGRLFTRSYEYEGQSRTEMEIDANAVGPDLARSTASVIRPRPQSDRTLPDHGDVTDSATSSDTATSSEGGAPPDHGGGIEGTDIGDDGVFGPDSELELVGSAPGREG